MMALNDEMKEAKRLDTIRRWLVLMAEATATAPDARKTKAVETPVKMGRFVWEKASMSAQMTATPKTNWTIPSTFVTLAGHSCLPSL